MMNFDDAERLVPFDQLHSPPDENFLMPTMGRRATMAVMESPSLFRSPAGLDLLTMSARKRKRRQDEDCLSIQSLDVTSEKSSAGKRLRKSLSRVVSLVNIASPVKPVRKLGGSLQRSLSFKNVLSPSVNKSNTAPYKKPVATPTKRRPSKLWQETVDGDVTNIFSEMQIKRQNAIFELYQSEEDLVVDLRMVKSLYHDSLKKLGLMTDEELAQTFGMIETLTPLHQDLAQRLLAQKQPDGSTDKVGRVLLDWISGLLSYIPYCANQIFAKDLLDRKRNDKGVQDFLQRCQESPFSRKLDLWTFLDVPRSRLVKYPLLLKNIQNRTPANHQDISLLEEAISTVESIIHEVDQKTGEAKCRFYKGRFEYIEEAQQHPIVDQSKTLLLDGILRNNRGTKLTAFLFDKALILTRPTSRGERLCYQVYRYPLALCQMVLEDLKDGEVKMGSFRNMLGQGQGSKHVLRVTWPNQLGKGYTHTLQARDEHDKKQWLNSINDAVAKAKAEKLKEGSSGSPVLALAASMKISDDDSDDLDDSPDKAKVGVAASSVAETPKSDVRKRSLVRRVSDCVPPSKRSAEDVVAIGSPLSLMLLTPSGRRSLTRAQSSCILTTPSLGGQAIPFADDSSSEDSQTPTGGGRLGTPTGTVVRLGTPTGTVVRLRTPTGTVRLGTPTGTVVRLGTPTGTLRIGTITTTSNTITNEDTASAASIETESAQTSTSSDTTPRMTRQSSTSSLKVVGGDNNEATPTNSSAPPRRVSRRNSTL